MSATADAHWWRLLDQVNHYRDLDRTREELMIASMLTGEEVTVFGQKARIRLEWPDGLPGGISQDELRQMGEKMKDAALARAAKDGS